MDVVLVTGYALNWKNGTEKKKHSLSVLRGTKKILERATVMQETMVS